MKAIAVRLALVCVSLTVISLFFTDLSYARIDPGSAVGIWFLDDDEDDIAIDSSGNGNDGKLMNGPRCVQGKFGQALKLDGVDDYVDAGTDPSLSFPSESFTVSAWIKTSKSGASYNGWILDTKTAGSYNSGYDLYICNNYLVFRVCNGPEMNTGKSWDGDVKVTDGNWHHVVGVVDRDKKRIMKYVDGKLDGDEALTFGGDFSNKFSLDIGSYHGAGVDYIFEGLIDEVAIFKRVLTEEEINAIMDKGLDVALGITAVSSAGKLANTWAAIKAYR